MENVWLSIEKEEIFLRKIISTDNKKKLNLNYVVINYVFLKLCLKVISLKEQTHIYAWHWHAIFYTKDRNSVVFDKRFALFPDPRSGEILNTDERTFIWQYHSWISFRNGLNSAYKFWMKFFICFNGETYIFNSKTVRGLSKTKISFPSICNKNHTWYPIFSYQPHSS